MKERSLFILVVMLVLIYYLCITIIYPIFENTLYGFQDEINMPCRVPKLKPFDKSILHLIKIPENITCSTNEPLVDSDLDYLYVNKHLLPAYGVRNIRKFRCCYKVFKRATPDETQADNEIEFVGECKPFFSKVKIQDEFVEVVCKYRKEEIFYDMFSFVPLRNNTNRYKFKQKLNVLIFGIDSLSYMNFQRQMPKTKKYIDEKLNAIPMFGFNKIADNTFPNMITVLTGQSVNELTESCWTSDNAKFDKCHFIWKNYSDAGYLTAFAEDSSSAGLFNYFKKGFQEQPTHYYWRTINYYAEIEMYHPFCLGPRPIYQIVLDYTKKFISKMKNELFFGYFWSTSLAHNCLNCPLIADDEYVEFFDDLKRNNVLNNTVVIFLSDHGIRNGDILNTYQGYLEERLPFVYFILPSWFNEQYPNAIKNMRDNSNRLTANYDIYETLLDLLDVDKLKTKYSTDNKESFEEKRGISLFSVVPEHRSCKMAGIPSHWCTCKSRIEVYTYSTAVIKIANFIVSHINNLLENHDECAQLKLKSINRALLLKVLSSFGIYWKEYTIAVKTTPGDALFESTIQCPGNCYDEELYEISGSISRLNRYGNQSSCTSYRKLKMFCYCME